VPVQQYTLGSITGRGTKLIRMRVLSIFHGSGARAGLFGEAVRAAGHELEERSYALGSPPAEPPEAYDAVMVFGGAMNVHEIDGNPWIPEEKRALERLLDEEVPLLGVCLGSQLLASVAGARVTRAREPEIGWYTVETTPEAADDPLCAGLPDRFTAFQWHSYAFETPPGAVPLAHSPVCVQAYRLGDSAWGTQFHAEVTREIVSGWIAEYGTDPDAVRIGFDPARQQVLLEQEIGRWNELGRRIVGGFLAVAEERAGVARARARA
jgi:GMP synthase (glutamine-hydrolysing)